LIATSTNTNVCNVSILARWDVSRHRDEDRWAGRRSAFNRHPERFAKWPEEDASYASRGRLPIRADALGSIRFRRAKVILGLARRSGVWMALFSSTQNTVAFNGGAILFNFHRACGAKLIVWQTLSDLNRAAQESMIHCIKVSSSSALKIVLLHFIRELISPLTSGRCTVHKSRLAE
jgi:hypothetical protein